MGCCFLGTASAGRTTSKCAGDLPNGLSLLFTEELAVKINPACAETSLIFAPTPRNTRRAGEAPGALGLGESCAGDS